MKISQRGSAMVAVLAITVILSISLVAFFFATRHTSKVSGNRREKVTALNIAEAGKEKLYADIRSDVHRPALNSSPVTVYSNEAFSGGSYTVSYSADPWADTLWIRSSAATANGKPVTIDVIALIPPLIPINGNPARGAVSARSNVAVSGSIDIDGREHDTACNLTGAPGTYAVSTCGTCTVDGSSKVGGGGQEPVGKHVYDNDIAIHQTVVQENAPLDPMFDSPEAFLGVPAGSLDAYKFSSPTIDQDFHGIRYDTASYVGPLDLGPSASGILIVHNGAKTAKLKLNGGTFRGLIICDEMDKINGNVTVRGAVVVLKGTAITFEGLGNASICYSSAILTHLNDFCGNEVKNSVNEISWKETD
ncbi:MAG: hypothetical protein JW913_03955 [Chitinispirillaceae bacterium]|nr:hypothetical protein [Chitinispirillaceae bacterium]